MPEVANSGFNFPNIIKKLCTSVEETLSRLSVTDRDTNSETQAQASLAKKISDFLEKDIRQKEKFISHLSNFLKACYQPILSSLVSTDGFRPCKESQLSQTEKLFAQLRIGSRRSVNRPEPEDHNTVFDTWGKLVEACCSNTDPNSDLILQHLLQHIWSTLNFPERNSKQKVEKTRPVAKSSDLSMDNFDSQDASAAALNSETHITCTGNSPTK